MWPISHPADVWSRHPSPPVVPAFCSGSRPTRRSPGWTARQDCNPATTPRTHRCRPAATRRSGEPVTWASVAALDRSLAVIEFDLDGTRHHRQPELPRPDGLHRSPRCRASTTGCSATPDDAAQPEYADVLGAAAGAASSTQGEFLRLGQGRARGLAPGDVQPDPRRRRASRRRSSSIAQDITEAKLLAAPTSSARSRRSTGPRPSSSSTSRAAILHANRNFLDVVGYALHEIRGKHHRMFVEPEDAAEPGVRRLLGAPRRRRSSRPGSTAGSARAVARCGSRRRTTRSSTPTGAPMKIVKFATDITARQAARTPRSRPSVDAVDRAQAVIEFDLDGNVLDANENFLRTIGYSLREIVGQHHSMFCDRGLHHARPSTATSGCAWQGRVHRRPLPPHGQVRPRRLHPGDVQPVLDLAATPVKVIKYAYDVTDRGRARAAHRRRHPADDRRRCASWRSSIAEIATQSRTRDRAGRRDPRATPSRASRRCARRSRRSR